MGQYYECCGEKGTVNADKMNNLNTGLSITEVERHDTPDFSFK